MRHPSGLAALIALLGSCAAFATTLLYRDVPALSRDATQIVRGTVTASASRWSGDGRRIFTETTVQVEETLKGAHQPAVTLRQPGGVVGELGQRVDGVAAFAVGEEVVVFLEGRPDGTFHLSGMAQGKYRVERSADGRSVLAIPESVGEAQVLDPVTRQPRTVRPEAMELSKLRARVAQANAAPVDDAPARPGQRLPPGTGTGAQ